MRMPLAFQASTALVDALRKRAATEGVDLDGPDFPRWAGNLLARALPDAVADLVANNDCDPEGVDLGAAADCAPPHSLRTPRIPWGALQQGSPHGTS
jgi:hypothetical protein